MKKGTIIYLNGVSSAGKTTLTRSLQKKLTEPYYWLANDTFCDMIPETLWDSDQPDAEYQALSMLHNTVKLFSDMGKNVIVDQVLLSIQKKELFAECIEIFSDCPALFVHVVCPIPELQRREKQRGDRGIGQAEDQLALLTPQDTYDITVDTFKNSTDECADMIIDMIHRANTEDNVFQAFKLLKSQML